MTQVAVVLNPSKFDDVAAERAALSDVCTRHNLPEPLFFETTEEDPGVSMTRDALTQGADIVCAFGGDGTVRAVAEALAGGDVPLGLLPGGTGNQLAHFMDLATTDGATAMETVVTGRVHRIDVGELRADGGDPQVFLVMAGMGLDAQTMDQTDERLKAKVGWPAYILGALRAATGGGFSAWVQPAGGSAIRRRVRAVIIGNTGRLRGGLDLMPDAQVDDGLLDVAIVAPRGLLGWVQALATMAVAGRRGRGHLDRHQATAVRVRADEPTMTQLDGDTIGEYRELEIRVQAGALGVMVPASDG